MATFEEAKKAKGALSAEFQKAGLFGSLVTGVGVGGQSGQYHVHVYLDHERTSSEKTQLPDKCPDGVPVKYVVAGKIIAF